MLRFAYDTVTAGEIAADAIERARQLGLPLTPAVYAVLFAIETDELPELRAELAATVAQAACPTSAVTRLYQKYFGTDDLLHGLKREISSMQDGLDRARQTLEDIPDRSGSLEDFLSRGRLVFDSTNEAARHLLLWAGNLLRQLAGENARLRDEVGKHLEHSGKGLKALAARAEREHLAARTDRLTRVGNRLAFDERLDELVLQVQTGNRRMLALLMVDVDHFKRFNDRHGHVVGDVVLRQVAASLIQQVDSAGTVCRFGGEEFAVLAPDLDLESGFRLADRLRAGLASKTLADRRQRQTFPGITISAGVAELRAAETPISLVTRADKALYAAKHAGRNRVCRGE